MFCDEINHRLKAMHYSLDQNNPTKADRIQIEYVLATFKESFASMQKVKLTDSFAQFLPKMADTEQFVYLEKIVPLARLMYPILWVEFAWPYGAKGILAHMLPNGQIETCTFLKQINANQSGKDGFNYCITRFQPTSIIITKEKGLGFTDLQHDTISKNRQPLEDGLYENDAALFMDYLARFNSPSIVEYTDVDMTVLNKKRTKNDKHPLSNHRVVDLSHTIKRALNAKEGDGVPGSDRRMHWVRGHFKVRKSGMFWWNPHLSAVPKDEEPTEIINKEYVA